MFVPSTREDQHQLVAVMAAVAFLAALFVVLILWRLHMKRLVLVAAVLAAAIPLSGCLTPFGRASVGELKPIEVGIQQTVKCSDIIKAGREAVRSITVGQAVGGIGPADTVDALRRENTALHQEIARTDAMQGKCEEKDASQKIIIDPEAGRKAIGVPGVPGI